MSQNPTPYWPQCHTQISQFNCLRGESVRLANFCIAKKKKNAVLTIKNSFLIQWRMKRNGKLLKKTVIYPRWVHQGDQSRNMFAEVSTMLGAARVQCPQWLKESLGWTTSFPILHSNRVSIQALTMAEQVSKVLQTWWMVHVKMEHQALSKTKNYSNPCRSLNSWKNKSVCPKTTYSYSINKMMFAITVRQLLLRNPALETSRILIENCHLWT